MFIVFDGLDKAGKTTHLKSTYEWLIKIGVSTTATKEPGGCEVAEQLRKIFLNYDLDVYSQLFLVSAARIEHIKFLETIHSDIILCDRFIDSTYAYQGVKIPEHIIDFVINLNLKLRPDFTFLFLNQYAEGIDLMDQHAMKYRDEILEIFQKRAAIDPERYFLVPNETFENQQKMIKNKLKELLSIDLLE